MSWTVSILNADRLAKKLDGGLGIPKFAPEDLEGLGQLAKTTWLQPMPSNWTEPKQISVETSSLRSVVSEPRYPYIFFERGSRYPAPGGRTSHRRRPASRASELRIKPRRYMARARAAVRAAMPGVVAKMGKQIEEEWSR